MRTLVLLLALLPTVFAERIKGNIAIVNPEETPILDENEQVVGIQNLAKGSAELAGRAVDFDCIFRFTFSESYFDGTIEMKMRDGAVQLEFSKASIDKELNEEGRYTIHPSPLKTVVVGGTGRFEGATGRIDFMGSIEPDDGPSGYGPTYFDFTGNIKEDGDVELR